MQQTFQDNNYGTNTLIDGLTMVGTHQGLANGAQEGFHQPPPIGNQQPMTHLPKYKVLDGKSTRVFECGICGLCTVKTGKYVLNL